MEDNVNSNIQAQPGQEVSQPVASSSTPALSSNPHRKIPFALIAGIILLFLIAGGVYGGFVYNDKILNFISRPSPTPTSAKSATAKNLNPNTGNLYEDIKVRLKEELK